MTTFYKTFHILNITKNSDKILLKINERIIEYRKECVIDTLIRYYQLTLDSLALELFAIEKIFLAQKDKHAIKIEIPIMSECLSLFEDPGKYEHLMFYDNKDVYSDMISLYKYKQILIECYEQILNKK